MLQEFMLGSLVPSVEGRKAFHEEGMMELALTVKKPVQSGSYRCLNLHRESS